MKVRERKREKKKDEKKERESESGEIVIEATFIVTICLFTIFAMISMGMYLYQQAVVRIAAQKTAADMAMVYPHLDKEPYYGYTNYYDFMDDYVYRNTIRASRTAKTNTNKAKWYGYGLLSRMSLAEDEYRKAHVDVTIKSSGVIERYVVVRISQDYTLPLAGSVFGLLGAPESLPISAGASAKVFDMTDFMSSYNFAIGVEDGLTTAVSGKMLPAATQWLKFVKKLFGWG